MHGENGYEEQENELLIWGIEGLFVWKNSKKSLDISQFLSKMHLNISEIIKAPLAYQIAGF